MRYHLPPVTMGIFEKTRNKKCGRGYREKGTLVPSGWECKLVQPLGKTIWRILKKLRIELSYDPDIPLMGIYPNANSKIYMYPHVHCSTVYNSQDMIAT